MPYNQCARVDIKGEGKIVVSIGVNSSNAGVDVGNVEKMENGGNIFFESRLRTFFAERLHTIGKLGNGVRELIQATLCVIGVRQASTVAIVLSGTASTRTFRGVHFGYIRGDALPSAVCAVCWGCWGWLGFIRATVVF